MVTVIPDYTLLVQMGLFSGFSFSSQRSFFTNQFSPSLTAAKTARRIGKRDQAFY